MEKIEKTDGLRKPGWGSFIALMVAGAVIFGVAGCGRSVNDYLEKGREELKKGNFGSAEKNLKAAQELAPNNSRVHLELGNLYLAQHNSAAAQREYVMAVELAPRDPQTHLVLARLLASLDRLGSAEEHYLAAIALAPSDAQAHLELAQVFRREGLLRDAEREFRTAIGLAPRDAQAHYQFALMLQGMPGRAKEAEDELARVKALDPNLVARTTVPVASPAATSAAPERAPSAVESSKAHPPSPAVKVKPLSDRRFLLTHDSPVYRTPGTESAVVAQVHRGKYVIVTGIAGDWLRIRLRNGTVGFIPIKAAE